MTRKRRRRGGRGGGGRRRDDEARDAPQASDEESIGTTDAASEKGAPSKETSRESEGSNPGRKSDGGGRRRRRGSRGGRRRGGKKSGGDQGGGNSSSAAGNRGTDGKGGDQSAGKRDLKPIKESNKSGNTGRKSGEGSGKKDSNTSKASRDTEAWAISRFDRRPRPMGIPEVIEPLPKRMDIEWPTSPVPLTVQKEVGGLITRRGEFGYLPDSRVHEIAERIKGHAINLDQALSLRGALNQEKSVFGHHRLMRRSHQLRQRYDDGVGILALAKDADAPPVNVFRAILTARGWSKNRIKESLKDPKRLGEQDREQFRIAEDADRVSNVDQSETHQAADVFEEVLCDHFERLGVRFRKQADLVREQTQSEGRPVRTPDLLLLDDVRIDGVPVAWLDAKHFFGAALSFPRKKTQKQIDRYTEDYGHGAIVYRHGFCDGLRLKGAILLDSSPLDLSRLKAHHESRSD